MKTLFPPFWYFGGKRRIAQTIWRHLGDVEVYIEPFCGSLSVLLARPNYVPKAGTEFAGDIDGHVINVWRSIKFQPEAVKYWADWIIASRELKQRRKVLLDGRADLDAKIDESLEYCDPKLAGFWLYCQNISIGGVTGSPVLHATPRGVHSTRLRDSWNELFRWLQCRLRHTQFYRRPWRDMVEALMGVFQGRSATWRRTIGIYLDPPYSPQNARVDTRVYGNYDADAHREVDEFCVECIKNKPQVAIVVSGHEGEHKILEAFGWKKIQWTRNSAKKMTERQMQARTLERIWVSPRRNWQKDIFSL